ncbi:MAG TPA: PAS domain-containing sensor histidine kinase [Candidatus Ozemobacteraceae bacterium]
MIGIPFHTAVIILADVLGMAVSFGMMFLVLWQAPSHRDNRLAAIYMAAQAAWCFTNLLVNTSGLACGYACDRFAQANILTMGIHCLALFTLACHTTGLWTKFAARAAVACLAGYILGSLMPLLQGRFLVLYPATDGCMFNFELLPAGWVGFGALLAFYISSCIIFLRSGVHRGLKWGTAITMLGFTSCGLPVVRFWPVDIFANSVAVCFFAYAIIREKLFNPLEEMNRTLAATNERLSRLAGDLRESEARLAGLLDNIPDAVLALDLDQKVILSNPAARDLIRRRFGITLNLGMNLFDFIPPDIIKLCRSFYDRPLKGECFSEYHLLKIPEHPRDVEIVGFPIRLSDARIVGASCIIRDITAVKQFEKELTVAKERAESGNQAKSNFLAMVSHELRTPLTSIMAHAMLMEDQNGPLGSTLKPEVRDCAKRIHDSAMHLKGLIEGILQFSRIEAGRLELKFEAFALDTFAEFTRSQGESLASTYGVVFHFDPPPPGREWYTDIQILRQVVINLLANAFKFTSEGEVRASITLEGPVMRLVVCDTGIGIPANELEKVFEPFYQVSTGSTRKFGGAGLGLAIVKQLIQALGGEVSVWSRMGEGTCFAIRLPDKRVTG